eukprot:786473_1
MSAYARHLVENTLGSITDFHIDDFANSHRGHNLWNVFQYLFFCDDGWLKLYELMMVFPSLKSIVFNAKPMMPISNENHSIEFTEHPSTYLSVLFVLQKRRRDPNFKLTRIVFMFIGSALSDKAKEVVKHFRPMFHAMQWMLSASDDSLVMQWFHHESNERSIVTKM